MSWEEACVRPLFVHGVLWELGGGREKIGREYMFLIYFYSNRWRKKVGRKCYWDCLLQKKSVSLYLTVQDRMRLNKSCQTSLPLLYSTFAIFVCDSMNIRCTKNEDYGYRQTTFFISMESTLR